MQIILLKQFNLSCKIWYMHEMQDKIQWLSTHPRIQMSSSVF